MFTLNQLTERREMGQAIDNYIKAATESGYDVSEDEVLFAFETKTSFMVVGENDNEDNFLIGEFIKTTETHRGDYTGVPLGEADTFFQIMQQMENVMIAHIVKNLEDWEQSCLFDFVNDLLNDVDITKLAEITEQQGF